MLYFDEKGALEECLYLYSLVRVNALVCKWLLLFLVEKRCRVLISLVFILTRSSASMVLF